jgi:hypothetical protein
MCDFAMTDEQMQAIIIDFMAAWPDAEFGPAHIVIADENFDNGHLAWCDGIIYAVQEERKCGGRLLYPEHSDNEIEATRRLLALLMMGQPELMMAVGTDGTPSPSQNRWEDVPRDT